METKVYDPEQSRAHIEQADASLARDDIAGALTSLEQASRCDPFNEELPLLAATLQLNGGDPVRAAHLAADAIAIRPFNPPAYDVLGVACIDALQPALGQKVLRKALRMAPGLKNLKKNINDAKRKVRQLGRSEISDDEIMRVAQLMPRKAIDGLLQRRAPTLSVCIVLDEGQDARLSETLESIRPLAEQIVIVDARRDRRELALDPDSNVIVYPFDGERSGPRSRNEALRRATSDWVLVLEAGERLDRASYKPLREALKEARCLGHVVELQQPGETLQQVRLLRNAPELTFSGRLAPDVHFSLAARERRWGLGVGQTTVCIRRTHALERTRSPQQRDELRRLIAQDLAGSPDDRRALLDNARIDIELGMAAEALQTVRRVRAALHADKLHRRALDLEEPVTLEGVCLLRLDQLQDLAPVIEEFHAHCRPTTNTLFLEGLAMRERGDTEHAAALLLQALEIEGGSSFVPALPEVRGALAPNLLGMLLMENGELDQAGDAFNLALGRDPDNLEAQLGLVALRLAEGQIDDVLEELDQIVSRNGDDPRVWLTGGIVLSQVPAFAALTVQWLEEASRRLPEHGGIRLRLGEAQLRSGHAELAISTWNGMADESETLAPARVAAALACGRDLPSISPQDRESTDEQVVRWFQSWMQYGALEALDQALNNLRLADQASPGLTTRVVDWLETIGQSEAAEMLKGHGAPASLKR